MTTILNSKTALLVLVVVTAIAIGALLRNSARTITQTVGTVTSGREVATDLDSDIPIIRDVARDAIPPLDNPSYESVGDADSWLSPEDPVLGIEFNGQARAYPLKIMNWHEIVNDTVGGEDVVVTYCPLCRSGVVFSQNLEGENLTFGNTGALYESAMVMYDRETQTYWYHVNGLGLKGKLTGKRLTVLPSSLVSWQVWKERHPNALSLSRDTGFFRDYNSNPYVGYYEPDSAPSFPVSSFDDRLPTKALVVGIEVDGVAKAYPIFDLAGRTITDEVNGERVEVVVEESGQSAEVFFIRNGERTRAPVINTLWFAWKASFPDTMLYEGN